MTDTSQSRAKSLPTTSVVQPLRFLNVNYYFSSFNRRRQSCGVNDAICKSYFPIKMITNDVCICIYVFMNITLLVFQNILRVPRLPGSEDLQLHRPGRTEQRVPLQRVQVKEEGEPWRTGPLPHWVSIWVSILTAI